MKIPSSTCVLHACQGPERLKASRPRAAVLGDAAFFMLAFAFLAGADKAHAATTVTTFQVTATVAASCSTSATNLAFGTYDPLAATATSGTSQVSVRCTLDTPYNIGLDAGSGAGATVSARRMTGGGATLTYVLYQDSAHLTVWGSTPGVDTVAGAGTGLSVPHTVYGEIPSGQNVSTGGYSDVITVSVNY